MTVEDMGSEKGSYDNFPVGMRVLAVDDDPTCLKLLENLLRKCQYHVTITSQARMALKMLRENRDRFDLVISDVHMPDMDGFKLLELVGLEMDLPVIMLSANSDTKLVMKGISHGACDYLVKPVRIEELRNIWQHVIRRKKTDSNSQNKSADQDKASGEGASLSGSIDQNGKLNKRRKDEEDENDENEQDNDDPSTQKKPRVVWSIELHRKFVAAVNQLGIEKAVPKRILDLMNVDGLTRENVASHLQKYRLYLKRISSVATQQANMVAAFGGKDSAYMRMGSLDGLGDFRSLAGPGRFSHASLSSSYTPGGMLGRLNSAAGVSIRNLTSPSLLQPSHPQSLGPQSLVKPLGTLGKLSPNVPNPSHNASLFQGIPPSLDLDQFQQSDGGPHIRDLNPLDNSTLLGASNTFVDPGSGIGSSSNPIMLHGNSQQGLIGNQHSLNMASLNSENLYIGVGGSSNFLDRENWQNSIQATNFQSNSLPLTETFNHSQLQQNCARENNSSVGPHLQGNSASYSSITATSTPFEDSRGEIQCRESINQIPSQQWGVLTNNIMPPLSHSVDQCNDATNRRMDTSGQSNIGSSIVLQHNKNEKLAVDSRTRYYEDFLFEPPKPQGAFPSHGFGSLDDLMGSVIKREQDGAVLEGEFGFDAYPFGPCI